MSEIFAITDKGMVREKNEDCFLVNSEVKNNGELYVSNVNNFVIAVADGMGGARGGEIASFLVLDSLSDINVEDSFLDIRKKLKEINQRVNNYAKSNKDLYGMGSTLVGLLYNQHKSIIFNLGDSRLYLFRKGYIRQLTKDHSLVQRLQDIGEISREEKKEHKLSNILTQCLGGDKISEIDPEVIEDITFTEGDLVIMCSDGLYNMLDDDIFEEMLKKDCNIHTLGKSLIYEANLRGGEDNMTLILVKVGGE